MILSSRISYRIRQPITGTHSPGPRIPDKLCGLSWPGIVRKPVNHASHVLADRAVKPLECLTRLVAEDDFINHWLQASFRLDLIPWDKRLARIDAGAGPRSWSVGPDFS